MVAQPVEWVDVEGCIRSWARSRSLAGGRVFFGIPTAAQFPMVVLRRIGGTDADCLVQFDVWGTTKADAAEAAADLATEADALARYQTGGVRLHAAAVESSRWLPDPETDRPRYVVDVIFTATAAPSGS